MVRRLFRENRRRRQLLRHILDGHGLDVGGTKPSSSAFSRREAEGSNLSRRGLCGSQQTVPGKEEHRLVFHEVCNHRRPRLCAIASAQSGLTECLWRPCTKPKGRHNSCKRTVLLLQTPECCHCHRNAQLILSLQGYVRDFIIYVRTQQNNWSGRDDSDTAFGASLAVDVVKTLQGNVAEAAATEENSDVEPMWLKLKWGIAIAARALDVWSARTNNCSLDMVSELSKRCCHER